MTMDATAPTLETWPHLYRPGSGSGPVLIALHGTGGSEEDATALAAAFAPGAAILAPLGRVVEGGMQRWFRRRADGVFDVADVHARADGLAVFLREALEHYGIAHRTVIATGFSNGANLALALGALHPDTVDRVLAFSGMYPLGDEDVPGPLNSTKVLLLNGSDDPMAPAASVTRLEAQLTAHGAEVDRQTRPGGHGVTADEVRLAGEWVGTL
jgi:phospholipase/carboxylesterase